MKERGRRRPEERPSSAGKHASADGARGDGLTRIELELPDGRYLLAYARSKGGASHA